MRGDNQREETEEEKETHLVQKKKVGFCRVGVYFYLFSSGTKDYMLIYLTYWYLEL